MKRITYIEIENYKAYIQKESISIPNGQNVLIYGENGSGKSSLYHALNHFLASSVGEGKAFELNHYSKKSNGSISVSFQDYDTNKKQVILGTEVSYVASEPNANNNSVPFIQMGYRVAGFLDYSRLLKVYLNRGVRPNLFELVIDLLKDYVPINQGYTESISQVYRRINEHIGTNYHRTDNNYKNLSSQYQKFAIAFPAIIQDLNIHLERLMSTYFPMFKLGIALVNPSVDLFEGGYIRDTRIKGAVYLDVQHYGQGMPNYNETLNEARLSAIAICLYLSSLKLLSSASDLKVLYIDDVFIGLDASNRRPVLQMLLSEFPDYQLFISTYDKSWYMLAREVIQDDANWEYIELYEGQTSVGTYIVPKPIIVAGTSNIDCARKYLYDDERPDYQASANYMRKAYEELLINHLYRPAILDDNLLPIAAFKIGPILKKYEWFISAIHEDIYSSNIKNALQTLRSYLRPMLHPLSHYVPDNPIYKTELIEAERLFDELSILCVQADYQNRCKVIVCKGAQLLCRISGRTWTMEYVLEMDEHLISYENGAGCRVLTDSPMHVVEINEITPGKPKKTLMINSKMNLATSMSYVGMMDCIDKLKNHLTSKTGLNRQDVNILPNITDMFYCLDDTTNDPTKTLVFNQVVTSRV